ncbi:hypothetical protein ACMBCM_08670, partial [Spiroplasma sp. K1]
MRQRLRACVDNNRDLERKFAIEFLIYIYIYIYIFTQLIFYVQKVLFSYKGITIPKDLLKIEKIF